MTGSKSEVNWNFPKVFKNVFVSPLWTKNFLWLKYSRAGFKNIQNWSKLKPSHALYSLYQGSTDQNWLVQDQQNFENLGQIRTWRIVDPWSVPWSDSRLEMFQWDVRSSKIFAGYDPGLVWHFLIFFNLSDSNGRYVDSSFWVKNGQSWVQIAI